MNAAQSNALFHPLRGSTLGALKLSIVRYEDRLQHSAQAIAGGELDVADDLYQAAVIQLWELDPSRYDEDDEAYIWICMVNEMRKALRDNR
jgi:DNA-directed RNA polymerase specialized sigma24 family protein